jgi:serine/threonine-protein kinase
MTQAGLVIGTPSYMSPEQAQGHAITGSSDLFSLAVVAYRVMTGTLPFDGPTLTALLTKILIEEPHYESSGLDPLLQSVFRTALAKDPAVRFQNCAEFIQALESAHIRSVSEKVIPAPLPEQEHSVTLPHATDLSQAPQLAEKSGITQAPLPASEAAMLTQKAKPRPTVLIAILAVPVLVVLAFFGFKTLQKPAITAQDTQPDKIISAPAKPAVIKLAPRPAAATPKPASSITNGGGSGMEDSAKPNLRAQVRSSAAAASGTIIWTGKLEKNSVLVITQQQASIGSIVGELPGKPVTIELEPGDVLVRQMPGPDNQWKQIILYSGSNRYRSITLYWKTTS